MKTDIEIAQSTPMKPIAEIAKKLNLHEDDYELYGKYKAKVNHQLISTQSDARDGKVILVTAINPTPAGEGKTTTSVGLADALSSLGKSAVLCLREPSLGPVFGVKGGAAGGGYAQVVPMEDINLHFTGDLHAIGAANNLLAAMVDNHIYHGNFLNIDPRRITWRRCVDMNDRQLRFVTDGLGGKANGTPREDGFDITVASEIMAVFCLADSLDDLKIRLARMVIGYTYSGAPVTAGEIKAEGALSALLKDAFNPNLVQTLEGTPAFIHGGPFANIAHGCNSVVATKLSAQLGDYVVTEAGFGADLGAEKFLDIKCRVSGIRPAAVVLVATIRALRYNGGASKNALTFPNMGYLKAGTSNLIQHIHNLKNVFGVSVVVALNHFPTDSEEEIAFIKTLCENEGVAFAVSTVFADGGTGGTALAQSVLQAIEESKTQLQFAYADDMPLTEKIESICKKVYHASGVQFSSAVLKSLAEYENMGYKNLPVCIAKTQYSFSDDPTLLGAPTGFEMQVRDVRLSAGAGFVVAIMGTIMTMPGLPAHPAAENINIDGNGVISGLF